MTYQRNPVCVKCTKPHFNHELRAGQEQEIKVEEVFELVKQHLKKKKSRKKEEGGCYACCTNHQKHFCMLS